MGSAFVLLHKEPLVLPREVPARNSIGRFNLGFQQLDQDCRCLTRLAQPILVEEISVLAQELGAYARHDGPM